SLDPLSKQYVHNSPYAFAENRVIDGIELEGLEFLDKDDAMVELRHGGVFLKIENFSNMTQNEINRVHNQGSITTRNDGTQIIGYDSQVIGEFSIDNISPDVSGAGLDNLLFDFGSEAEGSKATSRANFAKTRIVTGLNVRGEESKRSIRRNRTVNDLYISGIPTNVKITASAGLALAFATELYKNYATFTDVFEEQAVNEQSGLIVNDVMGAISLATKAGRIPKQYLNESDISDIGNVILFGGNGNEAKEILRIGMDIYNNFTPEGINKQWAEFLLKASREDNGSTNLSKEQQEAVKVKDNTRVAR
ncbi:hypothetical protein IRZ83_19340, partial [Flavobacterium sp. JLP]|nr:hypothetical protein [Flavobacterium sp. JLP]